MKPACAWLGILVLIGAAWPQEAGVQHAKHDINGQGCASCHVEAPTATVPRPAARTCDKVALWDCELPTKVFRTYSTSPKAGGGTAPDDTQVEMASLLCTSCHDGVSTPSMSTAPQTSSYNGSNGLQREHPINIPHDPAKDTSLATLVSVTQQVKLFGQSHLVQCSTCHDPHGNTTPKLLRTPKNDSSLCLICHL